MGLVVPGIALGVAEMVGIGIANASANRTFDLSTDAVVGKAMRQLIGSGLEGIPEDLYVRLCTETRWRERASWRPVRACC